MGTDRSGASWPVTVVVAGLWLGCAVDEPESDLSQIEDPQVLAISATPAEVPPGQATQLTALLASPDGTGSDTLTWSMCTARRPLAELGPYAQDCLDLESDSLVPLPEGLESSLSLPADACRLFGPEPPPAEPGQPSGRPVDADITGGYYQPLTIALPESSDPTLFGLRITCGLAGATQRQSVEFRQRYHPNVAPGLSIILIDGQAGRSARVGTNSTVDLQVEWPDCPTIAACGDGSCTVDESSLSCPEDCMQPVGCRGAETYLRFDPLDLELVETRESIQVAWYATAGSFSQAQTGRASDDPVLLSTNVWTAPAEAGEVIVWIVIRDARGASSWRRLDFTVEA